MREVEVVFQALFFPVMEIDGNGIRLSGLFISPSNQQLWFNWVTCVLNIPKAFDESFMQLMLCSP